VETLVLRYFLPVVKNLRHYLILQLKVQLYLLHLILLEKH